MFVVAKKFWAQDLGELSSPRGGGAWPLIYLVGFGKGRWVVRIRFTLEKIWLQDGYWVVVG